MKSLKKIFTTLTEHSDPTPGVVGIDIGASAIKVVELQERDHVLTVTTYGELPLGPYASKALGEAVTLEQDREQEALVDAVRESAVVAQDAVFAMPLSSSFITNVDINAAANVDLAPMVRVEARKVIPASLSEVTLDWAELDTTPNNHKKNEEAKRSVLIAAIQNGALERFKVLMKFAGLQDPPTEIECFSTLRSLYSHHEPHSMIVDIGARSAKLYITNNGLLARMHRVGVGGEAVTKAIAKEHSLSFEAAETKKRNAKRGSEDFAPLQKTNHNTYTRALREFAQVIREYEQRTGFKIGTVQLAGGAALFPGMDALVRESLRKEVVYANPFAKVAYPALMEDTIKEIGPIFAVSLGAALRLFE